MCNDLQNIENEQNKIVYSFVSHRRTITETDIVNFVNLTGLHAPPFIDMDWVKKKMPGNHNKRFAPAPFLISLATGLVSTRLMDIEEITKNENLGSFHGGVGIEAVLKEPAYPGDTLSVEFEASVDRKTKNGQTLFDFKHTMKNQQNKVVLIYTEKVLFDAPDKIK